MAVPLTGTWQATYHDHLVYDIDDLDVVADVPCHELESENISGHLSGMGATTQWSGPPTGAWRQSFYAAFGDTAVPVTGVYEIDSHTNQDPEGL